MCCCKTTHSNLLCSIRPSLRSSLSTQLERKEEELGKKAEADAAALKEELEMTKQKAEELDKKVRIYMKMIGT